MWLDAGIAIAGAGPAGLTSAACFCEIGHRVRLVETDPKRLRMLRSGRAPYPEPGLGELLTRHLGKRLHLTSSLPEALADARALFVWQEQPGSGANGAAGLALRKLVPALHRMEGSPPVLVLKSAFPPGTSRMAYQLLKGRVAVVANPDFLQRGAAIDSFFHPDRLVLGSPDEEAILLTASLYRGLDTPVLATGWEEAELIKYVAQGLQAIQEGYAREVAVLCAALGANVADVLTGLGLEPAALRATRRQRNRPAEPPP